MKSKPSDNQISLVSGTRDWLPQDLAPGTRDWLPRDFDGLDTLEAVLLDGFYHVGYERIRTPLLEHIELHERRSGAEIVSSLFPVGEPSLRMCLRPELTAGVARAYAAMEPSPPLPWRVSVSGPVFRNGPVGPNQYREFQQVGVELLGASGPEIDGEIIWLADWSLARLGIRDSTIRIGHLGIVLELLSRSGLPASVRNAVGEGLVQGKSVAALTRVLDRVSAWMGAARLLESESEAASTPASASRDRGGDRERDGRPEMERLFATMAPRIVGRRSASDVLERLERKWEMSRLLSGAIEKVRDQIRELAQIKGPAPSALAKLARKFGDNAPKAIAEFHELIQSLRDYGIDPDRVEIDMEFGRAPGYYAGMYFEILAPRPHGLVVVCGGGRYDGLARVLGSERDDQGAGFAFGLERLWHVLGNDAAEASHRRPIGFLVVPQASEHVPQAVRLATYLRESQQRAVFEPPMPASEAMSRADALALAYVIFVRGPWTKPGSLVLRHMLADPNGGGAGAGVETEASLDDLASYFAEWTEEPRK